MPVLRCAMSMKWPLVLWRCVGHCENGIVLLDSGEASAPGEELYHWDDIDEAREDLKRLYEDAGGDDPDDAEEWWLIKPGAGRPRRPLPSPEHVRQIIELSELVGKEGESW
jgi:hypothetical protein